MLAITQPNPSTSVISAVAGDLQWIYTPIPLPTGSQITQIQLCYQLSAADSYISQIRIAEQSLPSTALVLNDDPTDLLSTTETCVNSTYQVTIDTGARVSLRLNFGTIPRAILIGAMYVYYKPATTSPTTAWSSIDWTSGDPAVVIQPPNLYHPYTQISATTTADIWIYNRIILPTSASSITVLQVCYDTTGPTAYISQARITGQDIPSQATVLFDNGDDLPIVEQCQTYTVDISLPVDQALTIQILLSFSGSDSIQLGSVGFTYTWTTTSSDYTWIGSSNWKSTDDLVINAPDTEHPNTMVQSPTTGDSSWIYLTGLPLSSELFLSSVKVCYQVTNSASFISQIRVTRMTKVVSTLVIHDDATDLTSTTPTCVTSTFDSPQDAQTNGAMQLALRLSVADTSDSFLIGAVKFETTTAPNSGSGSDQPTGAASSLHLSIALAFACFLYLLL